MTEKNDVQAFPANLCRTMPYTAYVSVASYAAIFGSASAGKLLCCLAANELINHALKKIVKFVFNGAPFTKRPPGAMDTGIYPAHQPKVSTTSGMPSGHAQTSWFLATLLLRHLWTVEAERGTTSLFLSSAFIVGVACAVSLSRTRRGGILCVHVNGVLHAPHTDLQVIVGAVIGVCLALALF